MNDLIDTSQGPDDEVLNALTEALADRDRARSIAVALEQENAALAEELAIAKAALYEHGVGNG